MVKQYNIVYRIFLLIISFVFVLLFSTTTSPVFLSNPYWHHGDSGIFQEMGLLIINGGIPYVDIFDHKGPILFFLQALGLLINQQWGIFIIQSIFLFVTLTYWNKIIDVWASGAIGYKILINIVCLLILAGYYQRGNMCEEWSLPFITIPIYYFVIMFLGDKNITGLQWYTIGICCGLLLFIRANNIAPIIGFIVIYGLFGIKNDPVGILRNILLLTIGAATIAIICVSLFWVMYGGEAVSWMLYATFLYNIEYIKVGTNPGLMRTLIYYTSICCFSIVAIINYDKGKNALYFAILLSYFVTAFAIGSNKLLHYLIIFIPLFLVTLANIQKQIAISLCLLAVALTQSFYLGGSGYDVLVVRLLNKTAPRESMIAFKAFVNSLPVNERMSIYNASSLPTYYFAETKIVHQNRIVMESHLASSDRNRQYEASHDMSSRNPIWVLCDNKKNHTLDDYQLNDSIPGFVNDWIYCFRRL